MEHRGWGAVQLPIVSYSAELQGKRQPGTLHSLYKVTTLIYIEVVSLRKRGKNDRVFTN